jgi:hypothetical protein
LRCVMLENSNLTNANESSADDKSVFGGGVGEDDRLHCA